jgi:hypothetical protein
MKKLFLAAMLVVGATSFGAVVKPVNQAKGTTDALLPLVVTGNVVEPTDLMLEVTPVLNAGPDGKSLAYDFGDMIQGITKQTLNGTFTARLLTKDKKESYFATAPKYKLVKADGTDAGDVDLKDKELTNKVKLSYSLAQPEGEAGVKTNRGTVVVSADATGDLVTTGLFTDTGLSVKISIANQAKAIETSEIATAEFK